MLLELKQQILYGPVNSRRLGRSLGINILPPGLKICTLNCLYCQYGWTDPDSQLLMGSRFIPSKEEVGSILETALKNMDPPPEYLTFSGNGEPTCHPFFHAMVDTVVKARNEWCPTARTAILSNSSWVHKVEIRKAIARLDKRIMKLDAGNRATFERYNRPMFGASLDEIAGALALIEDVTIQALFTGGPLGNSDEKNIDAWIERIRKIAPQFVQIYTLDREAPSPYIVPLERSELERIARSLAELKIPSEVY